MRVGLADRLLNRPSQLSKRQQQRVALPFLVNRPALVLAEQTQRVIQVKNG